MKQNKSLLLSFVLGILTIIAFIPIVESIIELICSSLEYPKAKVVQVVLKENVKIQELQSQAEPVATSCMGFEYTGEEDYYDEDDFEDRNNNKIKLGFHAK